MATFSCTISFPIWCSSGREGNDPSKQNLNNIKINGTSNKTCTKVDSTLRQTSGVVTTFGSVASVVLNGHIDKQQVRQNIPTQKQFIDSHRLGVITEGGVGYRQTIVIRSYEVGPDKTATIESILNLLQETALNHVWMSGLLSNGFGATHGMMRNNLIWVVSRMHVQVDHYPIWGEVVEIDTWVGASGKNGMRRDWLIRSQASGVTFARATSTWVMMNEQTRRLSKMPEEVRAEISPWFIEKQAIEEDNPEKIVKLDSKATYVNSDLKPKRSDLDMNHHVNNVKYVGWMLETIPDEILEAHQLSSIILEYRRECGGSDIVQSLCEPDADGILQSGGQHDSYQINLLNGFSLASEIFQGSGLLGSFSKTMMPLKYTHLLQINSESKNEEIVRGRTTWKKKDHFHAVPAMLKGH
ncbi:palmitoyl-acyl carrier protein thioesterase, chloroplastic [Eucalyptus grandis]|uniref:palmitoyl-acyl carrier protein thioesterase, chloroplastic n=1 Tax=Eucalyptus grandis TaxID=71139 RepID=UPI00192EF5E1|nr:palmitoyl-acyl carrier protein thioesterase, chloroplastic [Eucalyptus grandis]